MFCCATEHFCFEFKEDGVILFRVWHNIVCFINALHIVALWAYVLCLSSSQTLKFCCNVLLSALKVFLKLVLLILTVQSVKHVGLLWQEILRSHFPYYSFCINIHWLNISVLIVNGTFLKPWRISFVSSVMYVFRNVSDMLLRTSCMQILMECWELEHYYIKSER